MLSLIKQEYSLRVNDRNSDIRYTANTGTASISTANSNLDGTGSITTVITGASNGTLINTIKIKAIGTTTRGMIRLFLNDGGGNIRIIDEILVLARIQSGTQRAFSATYDVKWYLKSGYSIGVSTQNSERFIVTAEGLDYSYPTSLNGL